MVVLAVTGPIGVGKSTVLRFLAELGWETLIADDIVRKERKPEGLLYRPIVDAFGESVVDENGLIETEALSNQVFGDSKKLEELEQIIHPVVRNQIISKLETATASSKLAVELPLLAVGDPYLELVDHVLLVLSSEPYAMARVAARSGLTEEEFLAVRSNQPSQAQYSAIADSQIMNDGDYLALQQRVIDLADQLS